MGVGYFSGFVGGSDDGGEEGGDFVRVMGRMWNNLEFVVYSGVFVWRL